MARGLKQLLYIGFALYTGCVAMHLYSSWVLTVLAALFAPLFMIFWIWNRSLQGGILGIVFRDYILTIF